MNNHLKLIGTFVVGFAAGAFFMHRYLNNKLDEQLAEEVEAVKEFYEKKAKPVIANIKVDTDEVVDELKKTFRSTIEKQGYDTYFGNQEELDESMFEDEDAPVEPHAPNDIPYPITQEQFTNDTGYEKTTLFYYANADVLTEDDDILDNTDSVVGKNFRDEFSNSEEEDVVYIRNEKMGTDYEIIRDWSSKEAVASILGFESEE